MLGDWAKESKRAVKKTFKHIIIVVVALGGMYIVVSAVRFGLSRASCRSEEKLKIEDLSGVSFDVVYSNCDTLAKDEAITVYARKIDRRESGIFSRLMNRRVPLFSYDPGRYDNPLPSITRPSESTIHISVAEVSEIFEQKQQWENMSVNYEVGYVYYPHH